MAMGRAPESEVFALGIVGAFFVLANSVADLTFGAIVSPLQLGGDAIVAGVAGILLTVILAVCLGLYSNTHDPSEQGGFGAALAIFAALSLWIGGGFLVGFVLAFTAGILAVILAHVAEAPFAVPRTAPAPSSALSAEASDSAPGGSPVPPVEGTSVPPREWICAKCDWPNSRDARLCEKCGAARDWWAGPGG
jgi:hypothetical protein